MNTPRATPAPVFKVLFAVEVAMFTASSRRTFLPKIGLACAIAIKDVSLSALFVVQNEGNSDASAIRPLNIVALFAESCLGM